MTDDAYRACRAEAATPGQLRRWGESCDEMAKEWDEAGSTGIAEGAAAIAFRNAADTIETLERAARDYYRNPASIEARRALGAVLDGES